MAVLRRTVRVLALALGLVPGIVRAAGLPLRYHFRAGEEANYRLTLASLTAVQLGEATQQSHMQTTLHMTQRVLAVGDDGVARVLTRVDAGRVSMAGSDQKMMPPREATMRMDPRGKILQGEAAGPPLSPLRMVFPVDPIEVGGSWTDGLPPSAEIPVPVQVRYTVIGHETVSGLACARIGVRIQSAEASAIENPLGLKFEAAGEILFAIEKGLLMNAALESDLELTLKRPPELGMEDVRTRIEMDLSLEYLPSD